jgi:hypothetical protein
VTSGSRSPQREVSGMKSLATSGKKEVKRHATDEPPGRFRP